MLESWLTALSDWAIALVGSPLVFLAVYAFATIDGFFPPIPSESVVIGLAALAVAGGEPNVWLLGAVAAAGAFTGDQIAYSIGKHIPVRTMRLMQGRRQKVAIRWAEHALETRGAAFIIAARYIPVGRVAVNMTAGTVGFSRRRFSGLAAIAAVTWSIYSVALGVGAGVWLGHRPWLAVLVGVAGGLLLGIVVDKGLRWIAWRHRGRGVGGVAAPANAAAGASGPAGAVDVVSTDLVSEA